jgi:hypothetical protein
MLLGTFTSCHNRKEETDKDIQVFTCAALVLTGANFVYLQQREIIRSKM